MGTDDRTGQIIQGRYRLLRRVGEGSQGKVYLAEDLARAGEVVALKLVEELVGGRRDSSADHVLRWFRHPNWATVLDVGTWGDSGWFEVTRFVHGTSLAALEGAQPESLVAAFLEQGVRVLGALHRRGLIHYDVTPGNWMLEWHDGEPHFVLTDGGLAHLGAVRGFGRGTPRYMAPEMTQEGEHDHRVDLYSLGLVAFRLATGREPIEGRAGEVLSRRRKERAPRLREIDPEAPVWAEGVIASLLARDPNHRPHDGLAVLRVLEQARGTPLPMFTTSEAAEATRGGRMIGNTDAVARIEALVQTLASGALAGGEEPAPTKTLAPVLVVRGPTDSGSTRLAGVALDAARAIDQAVVVLEGDAYRDAALRPFRDLTTGVRLILEPNEDSTSMLPAESVDAAVEHLVAVIEAATEPRSLLFVIRSFESLSVDARAGIQALARYLQARWTSQSNTTARIAMVIDLGESDATLLTLPDRKATTLAEVAPQLLDAARIRDFVADRMPGLVLDDADCRSLAEATEGLPGRLSDLLSQGCARGDVKRVGEAWAWDVSQLSNYRERHEASPAECRLIDQLSPSALHTAGVLALFPSGLPADTAVLAAKGSPGQDLPFAHLTRRHEVAGATFVRLHSDRVRDEVLRRFDAETILQLKQSAYETLQAEAARLRVLDRARTLAMLGDTGAAIECLVESYSGLQVDERYDARSAVADWATREPSLLRIATTAAALPGVLGTDGPSRRIAALLIEHGQSNSLAIVPATRLMSKLTQLGMVQAAGKLHEQVNVVGQDPRLVVDWHLAAARAFMASRSSARVSKETRLARHAARALPQRLENAQTAELHSLVAQRALLHGHSTWATTLLNRACTLSAAAGDAEQVARLLNNLGAAHHETGNTAQAAETLRQSLELRARAADVRGQLAVSYNLSRVLFARGDSAACSGILQRASALALRHGNAEMLSALLSLLGEVYDQQLNARLAEQTLGRAVAAAQSCQSDYRVAFAARLLAPIASSTGNLPLAAEMLGLAARDARRTNSYATRALYQITRAQVALHAGRVTAQMAAATGLVRLAEQSKDRLSPLVAAAAALAGAEIPGHLRPARPRQGTPQNRLAYRIFLAALRLAVAGALPTTVTQLLMRQLPGPEMDSGASGPLRRLAYEVLLAQSRATSSRTVRIDAVDLVTRYARHSGEQLVCCRADALRSAAPEMPHADRVRSFSDAVGRLAELLEGPASSVARWRIPVEFSVARRALAGHMVSARAEPTLGVLQALAHRLVSTVGRASTSDERLTKALRNVLQATSDLDASGDVDELLRKVTRLTIEMTDSERALVVRLLPDGTQESTIALSPSAEARGLERSVSQAVIRRTLGLRKPILLHDVYGDEELMQRPSITRLALRSIICAPMMRRGMFYGVVYADVATAAASFDQVDLEILSLFAEQVAGRLEARSLVGDLKASVEELRSAQERLVRGERLRTLGELSSGVAHEFNNLLTGILSRLQLLRLERRLEASALAEVQLIEKAALDAAEIVRRLQSFTRRQRERGFELVDVTQLCADAVDFLRPLWSGRSAVTSATVRVVAERGLVAMGSATELREVVTNLVKNALDACGDNGVVEVRASVKWPQVLIEVEDNGPGIRSEVLPRIFDPFYTTKGDRGSGLGLPLSSQIMERHSGSLLVAATGPSGTVMRATLPHAQVSPQIELPAEALGDSGTSRCLKIMVVDDDDNVREPLRRFLEQTGHEVRAANNARDVLEVLAGGEVPDLLITDISMAGMDGVELCRSALALHPSLEVVLMTGRTAYLNDANVRSAGARTILAKPFALQTIEAVVQDCKRGAK